MNAIPKQILIKDTYFGDISPDNSPPITVDAAVNRYEHKQQQILLRVELDYGVICGRSHSHCSYRQTQFHALQIYNGQNT